MLTSNKNEMMELFLNKQAEIQGEITSASHHVNKMWRTTLRKETGAAIANDKKTEIAAEFGLQQDFQYNVYFELRLLHKLIEFCQSDVSEELFAQELSKIFHYKTDHTLDSSHEFPAKDKNRCISKLSDLVNFIRQHQDLKPAFIRELQKSVMLRYRVYPIPCLPDPNSVIQKYALSFDDLYRIYEAEIQRYKSQGSEKDLLAGVLLGLHTPLLKAREDEFKSFQRDLLPPKQSELHRWCNFILTCGTNLPKDANKILNEDLMYYPGAFSHLRLCQWLYRHRKSYFEVYRRFYPGFAALTLAIGGILTRISPEEDLALHLSIQELFLKHVVNNGEHMPNDEFIQAILDDEPKRVGSFINNQGIATETRGLNLSREIKIRVLFEYLTVRYVGFNGNAECSSSATSKVDYKVAPIFKSYLESYQKDPEWKRLAKELMSNPPTLYQGSPSSIRERSLQAGIKPTTPIKKLVSPASSSAFPFSSASSPLNPLTALEPPAAAPQSSPVFSRSVRFKTGVAEFKQPSTQMPISPSLWGSPKGSEHLGKRKQIEDTARPELDGINQIFRGGKLSQQAALEFQGDWTRYPGAFAYLRLGEWLLQNSLSNFSKFKEVFPVFGALTETCKDKLKKLEVSDETDEAFHLRLQELYEKYVSSAGGNLVPNSDLTKYDAFIGAVLSDTPDARGYVRDRSNQKQVSTHGLDLTVGEKASLLFRYLAATRADFKGERQYKVEFISQTLFDSLKYQSSWKQLAERRRDEVAKQPSPKKQKPAVATNQDAHTLPQVGAEGSLTVKVLDGDREPITVVTSVPSLPAMGAYPAALGSTVLEVLTAQPDAKKVITSSSSVPMDISVSAPTYQAAVISALAPTTLFGDPLGRVVPTYSVAPQSQSPDLSPISQNGSGQYPFTQLPHLMPGLSFTHSYPTFSMGMLPFMPYPPLGAITAFSQSDAAPSINSVSASSQLPTFPGQGELGGSAQGLHSWPMMYWPPIPQQTMPTFPGQNPYPGLTVLPLPPTGPSYPVGPCIDQRSANQLYAQTAGAHSMFSAFQAPKAGPAPQLSNPLSRGSRP